MVKTFPKLRVIPKRMINPPAVFNRNVRLCGRFMRKLMVCSKLRYGLRSVHAQDECYDGLGLAARS